ncbi:MAG: 1-deoxy-D-xylulose-5-phosphate reductoisomerase [Planctomycetales bacterium]|nr:1-deoxy-D-xylulose-5-phosphate reductoisomerase [Planctomycetales bacterium]
MNGSSKKIAVLGATGSIGRSTLEVIAASGGRLQAWALSAHGRCEELLALAQQFRPAFVVASDEAAAEQVDWSQLPANCQLLLGTSGLDQVAAAEELDVLLAAIVGSAGLSSTWAAVQAGKTVALANKETLVLAGHLVVEAARKSGATILPVDSEHSAIFQAISAGKRQELRRIVLTASGGPFLNRTLEELANVSVEEALAHPNWEMGPKITVDSATMMNKALEIIEARWLFDLTADEISVVVHPQSIVHSMVEFVDGSVIAQLSPPDMKLPIQYALDYPDRRPGVAERLDWTAALRLDFQPPDLARFPALELGLRAARTGGSTGAVLNAANEAAVAGFLEGELRFNEIVPACAAAVDNHEFDPSPSLDALLRLDAWAREEVSRWVCT